MNTDLLARIEVLERRARHGKIAMFLALLLVATLWLARAAAARPQNTDDSGDSIRVPPSTLSASKFVLLGKDNKPYARFYIKSGHATLEFYDQSGNVIWTAPPAAGGFKPVQDKAR